MSASAEKQQEQLECWLPETPPWEAKSAWGEMAALMLILRDSHWIPAAP